MFVFSSLPQRSQVFVTDSVAYTSGLAHTPQLFTDSMFILPKIIRKIVLAIKITQNRISLAGNDFDVHFYSALSRQ
jgi:glycerol-3-phosphate responsive antiterminator